MMIELPLPPSVNAMFIKSKPGSRRGKALSPQYVAWRKDVDETFERYGYGMLERPYGVSIRINVNNQSDIDNRVKAVLDALVRNGVIYGDQWIDELFVKRDRTVTGCVVEWWTL
jgi:Holliday junction resolvase RusA-like endonuclease